MRTFLRNVSDNVVGLPSQFAVIGFQLTEQHGEQGRLAAAIRSDQTHPLPGMHLETDIFDEHFAPAAKTDVGEA